MKCRAGVLSQTPGHYEITEIDVEDPRQNELLVRVAASGICHTDAHVASGSIPMGMYPVAGGHEGSGVVEQVGPHTSGFEPGDHVVFSFLPACGRCRWCATGRQNLCDLGAQTLSGARPEDQSSFRLHTLDGGNLGQVAGLSTFSEYTTISVNSAVKVPRDLPLQSLSLLGCGVGTGWGSAVNLAETQPGHTVIVLGVGGVGTSAVQGAAMSGATNVIAVDTNPQRCESALTFGAHRSFADLEDAIDYAKSLTNGQGADSIVITVDILTGELIARAFGAVRKAGTVVVTSTAPIDAVGIPDIPLLELSMYQKRIQGSCFGASSFNYDIPRQVDMYRAGQLKLDEMISRTYRLEEITQAFEDLRAGHNIRGVIAFES